jgi:tetratricopeptide (TPR) repeat protein
MSKLGMRLAAHGCAAAHEAVTPGAANRAAASRWHALVMSTGLAAAAAVLGGCATAPPPAAAPAPAVVSLEEWLSRGDAARKEGLPEAARSAYREGAKSYPTDKQPWLRLSETYFNAGDYGNAVLAAQEAVQRDPQDSAAHSILAVSGLRITAGSLAALREQSGYPVGSREEALDVTKRLREALGDPSLLPVVAPAAPAAPAARKPRPAAAPKPAAPASAALAASVAPAGAPVAAAKPAAAPAPKPVAAPAANPLDKLK